MSGHFRFGPIVTGATIQEHERLRRKIPDPKWRAIRDEALSKILDCLEGADHHQKDDG